MALSRSKHWCFTIDNYTDKEVALCNSIDCNYIVWALEEASSTGIPQIQGYISLEQKITLGGLSKKFDKKALLEPARGSPQENRKFIFGPWQSKDGTREKPANGTARERGVVENEFASGNDSDFFTAKPVFVEYPLYPWQQQLLDVMEEENNDYVVFWVFDRTGKVGKTYFSNYLANKGWQQMNSKSTHTKLANEWRECDIVFDCKPGAQKHVPYIFINNVKDGSVQYRERGYDKRSQRKHSFSAYKANERHRRVTSAVLCLAHEEPKYEAFSQPRWRVYEIVNNSLKPVLTSVVK